MIDNPEGLFDGFRASKVGSRPPIMTLVAAILLPRKVFCSPVARLKLTVFYDGRLYHF